MNALRITTETDIIKDININKASIQLIKKGGIICLLTQQ